MSEPRPWTWAERRAIVLDRADHECAECGGLATEADHMWPRRHGGTDDFDNLQALCRGCNATKGDRLLFEHMTPARVEATALNDLHKAANAAGRAARFFAIAWAMVDGLDAREAHDWAGLDVTLTPSEWRMWTVNRISHLLDLPPAYADQPDKASEVAASAAASRALEGIPWVPSVAVFTPDPEEPF